MGWLSSSNRKKHQRRMNKYVRLINKNIYDDDLWRGRFEVRQVDSPWFYRCEDGSGASLEHIHLVITDKLTGAKVHGWGSVNHWCHFGGSHLWQFVNNAIVDSFDVWNTEKYMDPREMKNDPAYDFRMKGNKNGKNK